MNLLIFARSRRELGVFTLKNAKRVVIAVMGGTLLLIGAALMVLPGPGIPVVIAGLAVLAIEFAWARRWLKKVREWVESAKNRFKSKPTAQPQSPIERPYAAKNSSPAPASFSTVPRE